jgi:general secretion pathway protein D
VDLALAKAPFSNGISLSSEEPIEVAKLAEKLAKLQGKTLILGKGVSGKVFLFSDGLVSKELAYQIYVVALQELGYFLSETAGVLKLTSLEEAVSSAPISKGLGSYGNDAEVAFYVCELKAAYAKDIIRYLSTVLGSKNVFELDNNFVVLVGSRTHLKGLKKTIDYLGNNKALDSSLKTLPLKHASAKDTLKILKSFGLFGPNSNFSTSLVLDAKQDNILFTYGPAEFHEKILKIVKNLDIQNTAKKGKHYYVRPLEFSDPKKMVSILNDMKQKPSSGNQGSSSLLTDFEVVIDEVNNTLLIHATSEDYSKLNEIIRSLDQKRAQILFEVDILNVLEGFKFKFSTSNIVSASPSKDNFTIVQGWQAEKVFPTVINNTPEGGNITDSGLSSKLSAVSEDVVLGILTQDKFQVSGMNAMSPGALLQLMKSDQASRVLSSPFLMSLDGEEASLVVGDSITYKVSEISQGASQKIGVSSSMVQTKIEKENAEISLVLSPVVDNASRVSVTIDLKVTSVASFNKDGYPQLATRNVKQKVFLKNEQTIFISGFKTAEESEANKKVPFLGDIPLLSYFFRYQSKTKQEGRIMIFITPHIIWGEGDIKRLYEDTLKNRLATSPQIYKKINNTK